MDRKSGSRGHAGAFQVAAAAAFAVTMVFSVLVGTAGTAGASAASGSPLVFGVMGTNSGPLDLAQEGQAMQAYVANWNAHGGYKGHPIRIIDLDGALDPSMTSAAARTLVDSDGVIGIVDDYAELDCLLDNSFYAANHIAVLSRLGSATCYIPGTDFPEVKIDSSLGLSLLVKYEVSIGAKHIGLETPVYTGVQQLVNGAAAQAKASHVKFTLYSAPIVGTAADFDAIIAQMKAAGVDAVIGQGENSQEALLVQEANRQGFGPSNHIAYIFGPTEYNPTTVSSYSGTYMGLFGYPWTSSQGKPALSVLKHSGVKVSVDDGFAQYGYQAAGVFQKVLDSVKGPVTRASFLKAAEQATSVQLPLAPAGYTVDLPHPTKDLPGGTTVKATGSTFKTVSGWITSKY